jgi:hypothetical protein
MHWGLESGAYNDGKQRDYGVRELLEKRFEILWEHADPFDKKLINEVRKLKIKHKEIIS